MAFGGFGGGFGAGGGFGGFPAAAAPTAGGFGGFGAPAAAAPAAAAPPDLPDLPISLAPGTDTISSLSWSPDSRFLAASSWDSKVYVWNVQRGATGQLAGATAQSMHDYGAPVLEAKWAPDGSGVFLGGCNNKLKLWNLTTNTATDIGSHDAPIKHVFWSPVLNCVVTGSWDRTVRYWDPRTPKEIARLALPERVHSMDVFGQAMVVATADKRISIVSLSNPTAPMRVMDSPMRFQTRSIKIFQDPSPQFFIVSSIEGRCSIRCLDAGMDALKEEAADRTVKSKYSFAFKCHRDTFERSGDRSDRFIYSVNAMDTFPVKEHSSIFVTAGSDGIFTYWDRQFRHRVRDYRRLNATRTPITAVKYDDTGAMMAFAGGYDWGRGADYHDPARMPPQLFVHPVQPDRDINVLKSK